VYIYILITYIHVYVYTLHTHIHKIYSTHTYIYVYINKGIVCIYIYIYGRGPPHTFTPYIHAYIHTYVHTYLPACLPSFLPACLPTYLPTYLPTHRNIHTYVHKGLTSLLRETSWPWCPFSSGTATTTDPWSPSQGVVAWGRQRKKGAVTAQRWHGWFGLGDFGDRKTFHPWIHSILYLDHNMLACQPGQSVDGVLWLGDQRPNGKNVIRWFIIDS